MDVKDLPEKPSSPPIDGSGYFAVERPWPKYAAEEKEKEETSDYSGGGSSPAMGKAPASSMAKKPTLRSKTMKRNGDKDLMEEIEKMELFKNLIAGPVSFLEFYDGVSRIFEKLSVKRGGSHISLPEKTVIEMEFKNCGGEKKGYLNKEEFREFLKKILSRGIGLRNYEMAMYLAGVPVISAIIKPFIPGAVSKIPNSFFIPLVTSTTAFVLAHMRKI